MVTVVQVDRDLVPAERRGGHRQVVSEADNPGFAVFSKDCWAWKLTIEGPEIRRREIRVERMQAGCG